MLGRVADSLLCCRDLCRRLCGCMQMSPIVFCLVSAAVLLIVSLILVFNFCLARLFTIPGALIFNLGFSWLLLRLVARVLVLPGSIVLFKRSTEASYRVEMAKQFLHHLCQLYNFLQVATGRSDTATGATLEGAMMGCMVVEGLARNFRQQQRDQVRFTPEQATFRLLVLGVEGWLNEAKVCERRGKGDTVLLTDWMSKVTQSLVPVSLNIAIASTPLVKEAEEGAGACIERIENLVSILDGLQRQQDSFCATAQRFLRVPTVGSLHQLRAELQVRYNGEHYWVRTPGGRKIDCMLVPCKRSQAGHGSEEGTLGESAGSGSKEDVPLTDVTEARPTPGPVVVVCQANAAYYETMAYESHLLDFYISQGCSVFLFNYGGFGRSQGYPTPSSLCEDGTAVVDFLGRRGFTQVAMHGRSIGGAAACSAAQAHQDIVKVLIADRTFVSLERLAQISYGSWAMPALSAALHWACPLDHFLQARCYKVMIVDPKDATVPDLGSLRSGVAARALEQASPGDRLVLEDEKVQRIAEAWGFFDTLIGICDRDAADGRQCAGCCAGACVPEAQGSGVRVHGPARTPVVGKPAVESDIRLDIGEEDTQRLVAPARGLRGADKRKTVMNAQWLEEHADIVHSVLGTHADAIRLALDAVGTQFNAGGATLDSALAQPFDEACEALRSFVANIQVWGSLGRLRDPPGPGLDKEIEHFLQHGADSESHGMRPVSALSWRSTASKVPSAVTPDKIASYHRQLSRAQVAHLRREFRHRLSAIRRILESPSRDDGPLGTQLCAAVLSQLREIEGFLTAIYRFFKCVDLAGVAGAAPSDLLSTGAAAGSGPPGTGADAEPSDDSEEGRDYRASARTIRPTFDRTVNGYTLVVDCGHNGMMSEGELQHLALHLKTAQFGKYADCAATGSGGGKERQ